MATYSSLKSRRAVAHRAACSSPIASPTQQRGVVLFVALIILVAMTLATIALVRSVDTGTLVAGNIGFKQSAVQSGDKGSEEAIRWLEANKGSALLDADNIANGYYATRQDNLDLTGNRTASSTDNVDWSGADGALPVKGKAVAGTDKAGNQAAYVIHRLCTSSGSAGDPSNLCSVSIIRNPTSSLTDPSYSSYGLQDDTLVYYRVTTRVAGPKNTMTYVQTFVAM